jgi:hypothetical protein
MDIFEYFETLHSQEQIDLVNKIIDHYKGYLGTIQPNDGYIITHPEHFYRSFVSKIPPERALETLIYELAEFKSAEKCGNTIEWHGPFTKEIVTEIEEKFLPEEE